MWPTDEMVATTAILLCTEKEQKMTFPRAYTVHLTNDEHSYQDSVKIGHLIDCNCDTVTQMDRRIAKRSI